jgi:hypothetical protein
MATFSIDIAVNSKSVNELEEELKVLDEKFKKLKIDDPGFLALGNQIKGVKSQLKDVELQFEGLDKEQRATALVDAFTGLTGAVGAVSSAFIAFGADSAAIEDAEKKLLGVIGVVSGLRDASNGLLAVNKLTGNSFTKLGDSIKASFASGTAATNTFKVALAGLGIGLVIAAISKLMDVLGEETNVLEANTLAVEVATKSYDAFVTSVVAANDEIGRSADVAVANAELQGKSAKDITKIQQDALNDQLFNTAQQLDVLTKTREGAKNKAIAIAVSEDKSILELKDKQKKAEDAYDAETKKSKDALNKILYDGEVKSQLLTINLQKNTNAEAEKKQKENEAKQKDAASKELKAIQDKYEALRKLDEVNATEGLDLITTQYANNLSRIKEAGEQELAQENLTATAKKAIRAKTNADIAVNEAERLKAVDAFTAAADQKAIDDAKKKAAELLEFQEKSYINEIAGLNQYWDNVNNIIRTQLANGEITQEQFDERARKNKVAQLENELQATKDAGKSILDVEARLAEAKKAIRDQDTLNAEEAIAKQFAITDALIADAGRLTEALSTFADARATNEQNAIQDQIDSQVKLAEATGASKEAIEKITTEGQAKLDEAGKQAFEKQKQFAVASAVLDGGSAVLRIFGNAAANPKSILFPAQPYLEAAIAAVFTASKIKQIKSTSYGGGGGGGGGGGSAPSIGGAGGSIPTTTGTFIPTLPKGTTTPTGQGSITPVVKTYVVSGDVTDAQQAEAQINQKRKF